MKSPKQVAPTFKLYCDKAENALKKIADESVHTIITDPPYGFGMQDADPKEMMDYINSGASGPLPAKVKAGIARENWDSMVPMPPIWSECYRALMHGGYAIIFGTPATFHYLVASVARAGFKIKTYGVWAYASGTPRGLSQYKYLKKLGATKKQIKMFGHLRPNVCPTMEMILIAQKPMAKKLTVAENLILHGTGAINGKYVQSERFATSLFSDGSQTVQDVLGKSSKASTTCQFEAHDFCPLSLLIGQPKPSQPEKRFLLEDFKSSHKGGRSKKTKLIKQAVKDKYNFHPTVKPLSLMSHLVRLFSCEGQTVLDLYMGSGTTGVACHANNRNFIGIEMQKKFFELGEYKMNEIKKIVSNPTQNSLEYLRKIRGDDSMLAIFNSLNEKLVKGIIKDEELIYLKVVREQVRKMNAEKKVA